MNRKSVRNITVLLFCYVVSAASQSLVLKAAIGVIPAWDAITLNLAEVTGIRIGYLSMAFNLLTVAVWFFFLRKNFKPVRLLSILLVLFFGFATNFFYYDVFTFEVTSYPLSLVLLLTGSLMLAASSGFITYLDLISFPIEGLCFTLEQRYGYPIKITRTLLDLICILSSLLLSFMFSTTLKIREGTVVSMFLFGPVMGSVMDLIRKRHWLD